MAECLSRYVPLVILGICFVRNGSNCTADDLTKQRFLAEYPGQAKLLKDLWERCSGSFRIVSPEGKPIASGFSAVFFRSHGFEKVEIKGFIPTKSDPLEMNSIECVGDDGSYFTLRKSGDRPGYRIGNVSAIERTINMYEQKTGRCIRSFLGGHRKPLIAMLEEKAASLVDANQVSGNANLIEATFRVSDGTKLTQMEVQFDTTKHWAVVQQAIYIDSPPRKTSTYRVEYGETRAGIAMPRKIHVSENDYSYVFGPWKFEETPRESFSMTHYGLTDRVEAEKSKRLLAKQDSRNRRFSSYLIASVVVSILIGCGLYVHLRRATRARTGSVS